MERLSWRRMKIIFGVKDVFSSYGSLKLSWDNRKGEGAQILACLDKIYLPSFDQWRTSKLFDGFNYESKGEDNKRKRSWGALPGSQHFGGKRVCGSFGMGLGRTISGLIIHMDLHKPNNKLVTTELKHF